MTNGEKLENIYPDLEIIREVEDVYVIMLETHNVCSPKLEVFKSWWNAEYKEPSDSEKTNNSENPISSTTKNGISNRTIIYKAKESKDIQEDLDKLSELNEPTTKSETLVSLDVYNQVAKERDIAIQQLHNLGYELGIPIPDIKYHSHHCVDRRLVEALVHRYLKEATDDHVAFYEELLDLPLVTPIKPKGHWIEERNDYGEIEHWHCSNCYDDSGFITTCKWDYCPNCGSDNREVEE